MAATVRAKTSESTNPLTWHQPKSQDIQECGRACKSCSEHNSLYLHVEIENLKQKLLEREHHIVNMESNFLSEADKFPNGEFAALSEELLTWQDKYSRLYESHKRVQKVNQSLEDKLLKIVDKCETEKSALTRDVANLTQKLADAEENVGRLKEENEQYRNDVNLAIQLLQCKPANFVSQKYDTLPGDLQQKVRLYMSSKRRPSEANGKPEPRTIKVPIPTFPPTAMVYSINKELSGEKEDPDKDREGRPVDIVSAAIMAKVLEERERERLRTKHCSSCTCPRQPGPAPSKATQTLSHSPLELSQEQRSGQGLVRYVDVVAPSSRKTAPHAPQPRKADLEVCVRRPSCPREAAPTGRKASWGRQGGEQVTMTVVPRGREDRPGPRPCSMRLQEGSSNILLDNATSYAPVLYTGRSHRHAHAHAHAPAGAPASAHAVLVHRPDRSRSGSSSSSGETHM